MVNNQCTSVLASITGSPSKWIWKRTRRLHLPKMVCKNRTRNTQARAWTQMKSSTSPQLFSSTLELLLQIARTTIWNFNPWSCRALFRLKRMLIIYHKEQFWTPNMTWTGIKWWALQMHQKCCSSWDKARVRQSSPKVAQGRQLVQLQERSWMPWWIVLSCRYEAQWTSRWSWRTWQLKSHRHRFKTSSAGTQLDLELSFSRLLDRPFASEQLPKPGLMCSSSTIPKS